MSIVNQSKKILLVDDNKLILRLISAAFEKKGFKCLLAESAIKALEILQKEIPDIILSDYNMPEMNGFQFRSKLINNPALKNIPFIFLTSFSDSNTMMEGLNLKAVDYISKETNPEVIISKVDNILGAVREQQQQSLTELRKGVEALQIKSVPTHPPQIENFNVNFLHQSYQDYPGGDFIDFLTLGQDVIVVLGDVMGKKWGAWFFSFIFLSYIRTAIRLCVSDGDLSTASILKKINAVICNDPALIDTFSTVSLLRINKQTGHIFYTGAGDLPLLHYQAMKKSITPIHSSGMLLGLYPQAEYDEIMLSLNKGDKLIMITDGITDFEDDDGKKSDFPLLIKTISPMLASANTFEKILDKYKSQGDKGQIDDRSLIYFEKMI